MEYCNPMCSSTNSGLATTAQPMELVTMANVVNFSINHPPSHHF